MLGIYIAKVSAFFRAGAPFYKAYIIACQLYAGNATRMDAASAIVVGRVGVTKCWSVSVSCKQEAPRTFCIFYEAFLDFFFFGVIFCGTGRV